MSIQTEQLFILVDTEHRTLGHIEIERQEGDLLLGKFLPGSAFAGHARLFRDFEEAVNGQALGVVERLGSAIAALGLTLRLPDGSRSVDIQDLQIWSDGGISCRLRNSNQAVWNGTVQDAQSEKLMHKASGTTEVSK